MGKLIVCTADSDWPVSALDPLQGIHAALTRHPWSSDVPDQSLSLREAIHGYTSAGAFAQFEENSKGRLKKGYLADIVVLDGDIESCEANDIASLKVQHTICGGRQTYAA